MSLTLFFGGGGGQTIAVAQANETDLAQTITPLRTRAVGQAQETDTAQLITPGDIVTIGQASETDLAQAIAHTKIRSIGQASETDLAQAVTEYAPTRFYLRKDEVAAVSPAFHTTWDETGTSVRRAMSTTKSTGDTPANEDHAQTSTINLVLHRQYVSEPLQSGHTFDTTVDYKAQIQVFESGLNDNLADTITIRVVSQDGSTVRVVSYPDLEMSGGSGLEWNTSLRNEQFATVANLDPIGSYTTVAGDRLVVEFGHGDIAGSLPITGTSRWGSDGTDLPENRTETGTTFIPWFETSLKLTFLPIISVGQAPETDAAQEITATLGETVVVVGQAPESDSAFTVTPIGSLDPAAELDRAQQVTVLGGLTVPSSSIVLIRAPRKAGRIFHEVVAPSGDAFHPSLAEWEAEEDAPGGFRGAKGLISSSAYRRHRDIFQAGSLWRTFLEDGTCIFAGRLKEPDPDGAVVQLSANGRAEITEREVGPIIYQVAVGSEASMFSNDTEEWRVEFTTMSHTNTDTAIVFKRTAGKPAGSANVIIPFFGREIAFLKAHMQGQRGFISIGTRIRNRIPSTSNSGELEALGSYENYYFHFGTVQTAEQIAIDLTLGTGTLPTPTNTTDFTNVGDPVNTGFGFVWPDAITIEVSDHSGTADIDAEIHLSNIEVNGSPVGSRRHFSVGDLVEDIAARLGFPDVRAGGAYDILPYELPPGAPASDALDLACLISGKRYRILDTGSRATFEFGPWAEHEWSLASPWSPLKTIPEERYDAVAVPYSYPSTHGQLTDHVVVRVEDSPLLRRRTAWAFDLADPAHNRDRAVDLATRLSEELVRQRFGGDFAAAEVIGPDGAKLSAHHMNAGDNLFPLRRWGRGPLRVGRLVRFDDHVEGEFYSEHKALNRFVERRAKRQRDRE